MSDYITRLVAKNLNQLDVIKPRVATLFEPPRATGWSLSGPSLVAGGGANDLASDHPLQVDQPVIRRMPDHGARESVADRPTPGAIAPSPQAGLSDVSGQAPRQAIPAAPSPQVITIERQQPALTRTQSMLLHTPKPEAQPTGEAAQPARMQHTSVAPAVGERVGDSLRPTKILPSSEGQPTPLPASSRRSESAVQPVRAENRQRSLAPEAPHQPSAAPSQTLVSARQEPAVIRIAGPAPEAKVAAQPHRLRPALAERASAEKAAPEPTPTIHVTIGRVEVRAATRNDQPPARQRTNAPGMSLEEYLRQRSGGGGQ